MPCLRVAVRPSGGATCPGPHDSLHKHRSQARQLVPGSRPLRLTWEYHQPSQRTTRRFRRGRHEKMLQARFGSPRAYENDAFVGQILRACGDGDTPWALPFTPYVACHKRGFRQDKQTVPADLERRRDIVWFSGDGARLRAKKWPCAYTRSTYNLRSSSTATSRDILIRSTMPFLSRCTMGHTEPWRITVRKNPCLRETTQNFSIFVLSDTLMHRRHGI